MPFLPYNHLCLIYPSHPWLSLTGHPVQRYDYDAAHEHEAQSGWTTAKQTTKWRGGERQPFLEQKLRKKRESAIFLVVPWQRPKKNFLNTFLSGFNFYSFFVFNFLDSWNLIMDKFYNRQNNKSYCFFFWCYFGESTFFQIPVPYGTFYLIPTNLTS